MIEEPDLSNSLILVVDDVELNVEIARAMLKKDGYRVNVAYEGGAALASIREEKPDLILVDIMMPRMDGFSLVKAIKKEDGTSDIPVIFLTARNDNESLSQAFELGAVDYITKPFRGTELRVRVRNHLKLRYVQQRLQEANASKDRFFSIIAHDLRSPFTALVGMSRYLAQGIETLDMQTAKEFLEGIYRSSKNAFTLLENLLEWSRIQTGRVALSPSMIDVIQLIENNLSLVETNLTTKGQTVKNHLEKPVLAYVDENTVDTVIRNLITNAVKFTPRGGTIEFFSRKTPSELMISIRDDGVGMTAEQIEGLFRVDVRSSTPGTEQEKGTGLGMVLCKEFVEKNGGEIILESEVNKGTMITFTLPLEPPD